MSDRQDSQPAKRACFNCGAQAMLIRGAYAYCDACNPDRVEQTTNDDLNEHEVERAGQACSQPPCAACGSTTAARGLYDFGRTACHDGQACIARQERKSELVDPLMPAPPEKAWVEVEITTRRERVSHVGVRNERGALLAVGWVPNGHLRVGQAPSDWSEVERLRSVIRTGGAALRAERVILGVPAGLEAPCSACAKSAPTFTAYGETVRVINSADLNAIERMIAAAARGTNPTGRIPEAAPAGGHGGRVALGHDQAEATAGRPGTPSADLHTAEASLCFHAAKGERCTRYAEGAEGERTVVYNEVIDSMLSDLEQLVVTADAGEARAFGYCIAQLRGLRAASPSSAKEKP